MQSSLSSYVWIAGAGEYKAFSCQMSIFHEGDQVWSGFQAKETTSKPAEHREHEAAHTLVGPRQTIRLAEKKACVAFLSKDVLVQLFAPQGELIFPECRSQKLVLCHFRNGPLVQSSIAS